jgi:hypothetical protein
MTSLKKYVRNVKNVDVAGCTSEANRNEFVADGCETFSVEGKFIVEDGTTYSVVVSNDPKCYEWSNGSDDGISDNPDERVFVKGLKKDHPWDIKRTLTSQCYMTSYDKELNRFQLRKDRWDVFKKLFETVTGFSVEKVDGELDENTISNKRSREAMAHLDQFILGVRIKKPHETISERQCSDGEKKIIKNFTTLLNKDCLPSIILIDNIEMHVEIDRHMALLSCVRACFPDSQIIYTTHSERIISEANLRELVSLVNKNIPRDQMWRSSITRVLKGLQVSFRDDKSQSMCGALFADLVDERYNDTEDAKNRLYEIIRYGSEILENDIRSIEK